jgi:mono/diheme cytochrome c family protein
MVRELWGPGRMPRGMMVRLLRHTTFMQYGVPKEYQGQQSNAPAGPETITQGHKIYAERCASCHGRDGLGNGEAGNALSPSPALLAYMIRRPIAVDEYLLWTVSEGGKQFGSEMPAFKDKLVRDDIWRVVAYMRAGFPAGDGGAGKPAPKP